MLHYFVATCVLGRALNESDYENSSLNSGQPDIWPDAYMRVCAARIFTLYRTGVSSVKLAN